MSDDRMMRSACARPTCRRRLQWLRQVIDERDAAVAACQFVKDWLRRLEESIDPQDEVLAGARKQFHAPLHEKLDAALRKAGAQ